MLLDELFLDLDPVSRHAAAAGAFDAGELDAERATRLRRRRAPRRRPTATLSRPRRRRRRRPRRPLVVSGLAGRRDRSRLGDDADDSAVATDGGSEDARWVQATLNRVLGLRLAVTGTIDERTRDVLRTFQRREGLPVTGIAGPETKQALIAASRRSRGVDADQEIAGLERENGIADLPKSVLDALSKGLERVALQLAAGLGRREENQLTNTVFFRRHPERKNRKLTKGEPNFTALSREWLAIRDRLVRPIREAAESAEAETEARGGARGENALTNRLFFKRYPARKSAPLQKSEPGFSKLSREWLDIRNRIVRLALHREFFRAYELRFNPGSSTFGIDANPDLTAAQKANRKADVTAVVSVLVTRRDARATAALTRTVPSPAAAPAGIRSAVLRLSAAQLTLFREFLADSGAIDVTRLQRCFEHFANGELRRPAVGGGFGEPDGGFYFLFAEFAFLCIDSGIETRSWTSALRAFVKTQEIFMHVYRPSPVSPPPSVSASLPGTGAAVRPLDAYRFANFSQVGASIGKGKGQSNDTRKAALRRKYDRLGLSSLRAAARDNLLRAQRMP